MNNRRIKIDDRSVVDSYWQGVREGHDPEVAEDLGIPTYPATVEKHFESGQLVRKLMAEAAIKSDRLSLPKSDQVTCGDCNKPGCPGCKY